MTVPFTINGLAIGADLSVPRFTGHVKGLGGPGARYSSGARVQADGSWSTVSYRTEKALLLTGSVWCDSVDQVTDVIDQLNAAISISPVSLTVHWPSGDRTMVVKRDGDVEIDDQSDRLITWSATVVSAKDPSWYVGGPSTQPDVPGLPDWPADGVLTARTALPGTSGGMSFPFAMPFAFTASSSSGDVQITTRDGGLWGFVISNDGDDLVNPRIIVTYPDGSVRRLSWRLTLRQGEELRIDPQAYTALLQGMAPRPPEVREWPALSAGSVLVQFRAESGGWASTTVPADRLRTNRHPNPFAVGLSGWSSGAVLTETTVDSIGGVTWDEPAAVITQSVLSPVSPSEVLSASAMLKLDAAADVRVIAYWRDSGGGLISADLGDPIPVAATVMTQVSRTLTAPAGAATVALALQIPSLGFAGGVMLGADGEPFSGESEAAGREYVWTGTPYASASEEWSPSYTTTEPTAFLDIHWLPRS